MTEENKKTIPLYILAGDMGQSDTRKAKELLDGAGIEYLFAAGDRMSEFLPQLSSGLVTYVGLERIANFVCRAEHERKLRENLTSNQIKI